MENAILGLFASDPAPMNALAGLAAMLLGLAILVEVIQEAYKFLTSSKSRTYAKVLNDFAGPWVQQLFGAGPVTQLHVRRPFQWIRSRPEGALLPLDKEQLLEAIDRTAADWILHSLEALKIEKQLQSGKPAAPSPGVKKMIAALEGCGPGVPGYKNARDIVDFFAEWHLLSVSRDPEGGGWQLKLDEELDAGKLLTAFYQRFFPERVDIDKRFAQLEKNFEFAYQRRNLRQTFVFALLVALLFNFPFDELYRQATQRSTAETTALAEKMIGLYQERLPQVRSDAAMEQVSTTEEGRPTENGSAASEQVLKELHQQAVTVLAALSAREGSSAIETPYYTRGLKRMAALSSHPPQLLAYLFNCLVTAFFISFGAPFWHRVTSALLRRREEQKQSPNLPGA